MDLKPLLIIKTWYVLKHIIIIHSLLLLSHSQVSLKLLNLGKGQTEAMISTMAVRQEIIVLMIGEIVGVSRRLPKEKIIFPDLTMMEEVMIEVTEDAMIGVAAE